MLSFENCRIKKFWPHDDKGDEDEIIRQVMIQVDAEILNSGQVGELYNNLVRGLVRVSFLDPLTGEEYVLPAAGIRPFNIKQKKVKLGGGQDYVKSEFAEMTLVAKIPEDSGGALLADLYRFFGIPIRISMEELSFGAAQE
ncbi:MAG: hypothetical protein ONB12_13730, partial [candidate division KSB1 bacterium]|nr:hypothetical protein [candidate division KSB1 bacterium]